MATGLSAADAEREWEYREAFGHLARSQPELLNDISQLRNNDPELQELNLSDYDFEKFTDLAWTMLGRYIVDNTHLEIMNLPELCMEVVDEEISYLGRVTSLMFKKLTRSLSLVEFDVSGNEIGLDGVQSIIPFLQNSPNLTEINFSFNRNIDSECFKVIVEALDGRPVEELDFGHCNINDIMALENVTLPHLPRLLLNANNIERLPSLGNYANLDELFLSNNKIQTIPSLEMLTNLISLALDNNRIEEEGFKDIAKLLQNKLSSLRYLVLMNNRINDEMAEILADSLQKNNTVEQLILDGHDFKEKGYRAFSILLNDVSSVKNTYESNHTLAELRFSSDSSSKNHGVGICSPHWRCSGNKYKP